jgi:ribosomal protein S27AE
MVRAIKVRFIDGDGEKKESRAFHVHRTTAWEREPRRYRSFEVLHGETAFAVQMMDDAFADLIRWRMKYEPYSFMWAKFGETFQGIVNQIDEFADDCRATNNADEMDNALVGLLVWRDQFAAALETWVEFHSHIEFVMDAIADAEKVFVGATEQKERNCLRCGSPFMSAHAGHRICEKCFHMFDKGISGAVESREFMKPKEDV